MDIKTGYVEDSYDENDLVFGSEQSLSAKFAGHEVLSPQSDWSEWLPEQEHQAPDFETNGCVSFTTTSVCEILKKRQGDTEINLSDRFLAKASDTDPARGNTPRKVADTLKKQWSVFEHEYPRPATLDEFYAEIPKQLKALAKERGRKYDFGYERVNVQDIREALKYSPLGIATLAWVQDDDGKYYRPDGMRDTHYTVCYGIEDNSDLKVFDSYPPFLKVVRADMIPSVVYSYYLKSKARQPWWIEILRRIWF